MSLKTFTDARLSMWQSTVEEVLKRREGMAPGTRPTMDHPVVAAAAASASAAVSGVATTEAVPSAAAPQGCTDDQCAHLALQLATAKVEGRPASEIQPLEDALKFSTCDPLWADSVAEYVKYFDVDKGKIPYRASTGPDDPPPLTLKGNATLALIGEWGTGTVEARSLL